MNQLFPKSRALSVSRADAIEAHAFTSRRLAYEPTVPPLEESADVGPPGGRIVGIDAARGLAMVLVCLSHVRIYVSDSAPQLYAALTAVTRFATPSFLLLSGFVAAHVLCNNSRRDVSITLIDRGLFLLVVGHVLLGLDELRVVAPEEWLFGRIVVTDAIGVCLIVATAVRSFSATALLLMGAALSLLSWPVAMTLTVESEVAQYLGAVLFNLRSTTNGLVDAAVVPYLGMFLVGMGLNKWTQRLIRSDNNDALARRLLAVGCGALACAVLGIATWYLLKRLHIDAAIPRESLQFWRSTLDPFFKLPPSPAYLLCYGGGGLLIAALCLNGRPSVIMRPLVTWSSVLGRTSLMCFVVQDWLLRLLPPVVGFDDVTSVIFWVLYVVASIALLHLCARRWEMTGGNRFLTLGLKSLARRAHASQP